MFPKKIQPKRLAQLIVANVARHLANFMLANGEFESPALEELFYVENFTSDAIHKFGEASLTFPHKIFLEKNKWVIYKSCQSGINIHLDKCNKYYVH